MKVKVLSRERDFERKFSIENQLNIQKLNFSFYNAFEPHTLPDSIKRAENLTAGEICCALGHVKICEEFIEESSGNDILLIMEDDAKIHADLNKKKQYLTELHKVFDVVILGYSKSDDKLYKKMQFFRPVLKYKVSDGFFAGIPYKQWTCGTVAYSVSQRGAEKIIKINSAIDCKADDWPYFESMGLKIAHALPNFVSEDFQVFPSSLENERKTYVKTNILKRYFAGIVRRLYLPITYCRVKKIFNT